MSNDHGELLLAMMFLQGQQLAAGAAFLLPPRLHATNASSLGLPAHEYASLEDIIRVLEEWNPRVVALMSGYLFSNNKLLSRGNLRKLVRHLHAKGRHVLTSDPFLGLAGTLSPHDVRLGLPEGSPSLTLAQRWSGPLLRWSERRIVKDLTRVSQILAEVVHLYPVPAMAVSGEPDAAPGAVRRASFFNRELIRPTAPSWGVDRAARGAAPRRWLFILASQDVWYQQQQVGEGAFVQKLTRRLEDAVQSGRRPSVIGPPGLLTELSARLPPQTTVELLRFCGHHDFVSRLMDAEYVFYWNLFSASLMLRVSRGRPAFFFDRGHVSRLIAKMYQLGLRVHLRGWEPEYLALDSELDTDRLAALASEQAQQFKEIGAYWEQSPTPDALFDALLREPARAG